MPWRSVSLAFVTWSTFSARAPRSAPPPSGSNPSVGASGTTSVRSGATPADTSTSRQNEEIGPSGSEPDTSSAIHGSQPPGSARANRTFVAYSASGCSPRSGRRYASQ